MAWKENRSAGLFPGDPRTALLSPGKEQPLTKTLQKCRLGCAPDLRECYFIPPCVRNSACCLFGDKKANCCAEAFGGRAPPDWHGASTAACHSATSCAVTAVPGDSAALSSPESDIS